MSSEVVQDGGHVYLSCSDCRAKLVDVWITRPAEDIQSKLSATCPFCGDKSFSTEVTGGFHVGGFSSENEDGEDIPSTIIDGSEIIDNSIVFYVKKATDDAKPFYSQC